MVDPCPEGCISYSSIRTWCPPCDISRGAMSGVLRESDMRHRAAKLKWRKTIYSSALFGRYEMAAREGRDGAGAIFFGCYIHMHTCSGEDLGQ